MGKLILAAAMTAVWASIGGAKAQDWPPGP